MKDQNSEIDRLCILILLARASVCLVSKRGCKILAVFSFPSHHQTFQNSLSKLHYLPITSNLYPHTWNTKRG
ncbi:hypothetical protein, partial [Flavobacterium sp. SaA2.13]|uniref:hypothetical protein n=1 Tax=Flavobacterium sp. SaA2.13 TaxID=2691898 RepID=UPI001CEF6DC7